MRNGNAEVRTVAVELQTYALGIHADAAYGVRDLRTGRVDTVQGSALCSLMAQVDGFDVKVLEVRAAEA